ncbi:MAG: response regulator transcription factor [Candidatus Marinimicrobia bacterium]|nr:response regulator transcription factor [Candidatus Neomarinimicrobiota bacterium]
MSHKVLIIDDENLAMDVIESHLAKFSDFEVAGRCTNALQAMELLRREPVNLIFLDIQMPEISGLDFLKNIATDAEVIITTAFREFAVEGFEFNVLDYLLKPISLDRFMKAIDKFYRKRTDSSNHTMMPDSEKSQPQPQSIYIRSDRTFQKINVQDIIYIESIKDYVKIFTSSGMKVTKQSISKFEEDLSAAHFLRIHRSYLVNLERITGFTHASVWIDKKEVTIGKTYQERVVAFLNNRMRLI